MTVFRLDHRFILPTWPGLDLPDPLTPLPAFQPDPALAALPFRYFHVISEDPVPIVSAPGDTAGGQDLYPGFVYVAYSDRLDTGHGIYYLTAKWRMDHRQGRALSGDSCLSGASVQRHTQHNSFGWTFEDIPIKSAPGYNAPDTGRRLAPFTVVQIFDTQNVDCRRLEPHRTGSMGGSPQSRTGGGQHHGSRGLEQRTRWIDVNLAEQTLAVYDDNQLVFATVIASGLEPFWTKPGLFQIQQKKETETMRNNDQSDFYYLEDVPWTMYYDGPRALHGAYWRTRFGYPQSHGCVNLSVGDAHWLFNWAHEGDWVYVHDPSGQTPTDPAIYQGRRVLIA